MIASWNGLALAALAEGARRLERGDLLAAAVELGELLCDGPALADASRDGRAKYPAYLDDYANVAHGLYELHVATGDLRWLREARRLALAAVELFGDPERGGFFLAPADGEQLVARQKALRRQSDAVGKLDARVRPPAARADLGRRRARADGGRCAAARRATCCRARRRRSAGRSALSTSTSRRRASSRSSATPDADVARAALRGFDPNAVVAFGPADDVPLLAGKTLVDGRPAVYVCERFACRAPVTDASELA